MYVGVLFFYVVFFPTCSLVGRPQLKSGYSSSGSSGGLPGGQITLNIQKVSIQTKGPFFSYVCV